MKEDLAPNKRVVFVKKEGKNLCFVWCTVCHKKVTSSLDAVEAEADAKRHTEYTGHNTILGFMTVLVAE